MYRGEWGVMLTTKLVLISILLIVVSGCSTLDFIKCGDRGVCEERWFGFVRECCK